MSLHEDAGLDLNAISRYGNKLGESENAQLVQAVVAPGSEFLGRSIRELDFSRQFDAVIVGLWRREGPVADRLSDARLREAMRWSCGDSRSISATWPRTMAS